MPNTPKARPGFRDGRSHSQTDAFTHGCLQELSTPWNDSRTEFQETLVPEHLTMEFKSGDGQARRQC